MFEAGDFLIGKQNNCYHYTDKDAIVKIIVSGKEEIKKHKSLLGKLSGSGQSGDDLIVKIIKSKKGINYRKDYFQVNSNRFKKYPKAKLLVDLI